MAKKVRVGQMVKVENTYKKRFANPEYNAVIVKINGIETPLFFTDDDILEAYDRAVRNYEDSIERSFISKLID